MDSATLNVIKDVQTPVAVLARANPARFKDFVIESEVRRKIPVRDDVGMVLLYMWMVRVKVRLERLHQPRRNVETNEDIREV